MATVAQLAARAYQEIGYLFVVDGWPVAFSNRVELCGSGGGSWIGTSYGARTVALGLEPPRAVKLGIGLLDSGMPVDDGLELTIVDRDGYLVDLMTDEAGDLVVERLGPGTTATEAAPATLTGAGGNAVTVRGRWINGESIGSSGERRQFPILPGVTLPGFDHVAVDSPESTLRLSVVRDEARWLEGLQCALYLIRKDVQAGTWPSWEDQYDSGYSLIWWGSLRAATAEARAWRLSCDGPSSWLRRALNVTAPSEFRLLTPLLALEDGEDEIAVAFSYMAPLDETESCATSAYAAASASNVITSGQTPVALASEINTRIQDLADDAGTDGTFETFAGGEVHFDDAGFTIKVDGDNAASTNGYNMAGVMQLRMHKKAWLHLGWDLTVQGIPDGLAQCNSEYEVVADTTETTFYPIEGSPTADPAPGYWEARFSTVPLKKGWMPDFPSVDNGGKARTFRPIYGIGGSTSVLQPEAEQSLDVGFGVDAPFWSGQLAKPPADVTLHGDACDRAGFVVIRGPYRTSVDEDPQTVHRLARVSWVDDDGKVAADTDGRAVMWLEEWLDARLWGGVDGKLTKPWAAKEGQVEWCPIALLTYHAGQNGWADAAHVVLLRLLLSTGTGSWSGVGQDAAWVDGDNAHDDASGAGDDREVADLGLGIPESMVDWDSFGSAAATLPGGKGGKLDRLRLGYIGPFDSQECIEQILRPRGWCFSLDGGQYGLFAKHAPLDVEDVQVTITELDVAADPEATPPAESVDFHPLEPVDLVTVKYGESQVGGDGRPRELTVKARDPRAHARRGNAKIEIDGRTLVPSGSWGPDFTLLWGEHLARYHGEPHATVRVAVKGDKARDLWPGTIVSYSSDWPPTRSGSYGMSSRVGRVLSVERDTQTLAATCEILVDGKDAPRRFAPIARLIDSHSTVEARHDAANKKVYCYADAFGRGGSRKDVEAFVKPSWATASGSLLVALFQSWDGVTWEATAVFDVASVSTADNSITYTTLVGDVWEDRFGIIIPRDWDNLTASTWPLDVFAPLCGVDAKHSSGDEDGYPWAE